MPSSKATPEEIEHYTKICLERGGRVGGPGAPAFGSGAPSAAREVVQKSKKATPQVFPDIEFQGNAVLIVLPILTKSEANQGGNWKGKSQRTKDARRQMSKLCGPKLRQLARFAEHYHQGGILKAKITRLGGRHLDKMANLGAALKATEDAICLMLGVDDGDPRWQVIADQEPGGDVGVSIEITIVTGRAEK